MNADYYIMSALSKGLSMSRQIQRCRECLIRLLFYLPFLARKNFSVFQAQAGYETLTIESVAAVWTYLQMFACAWANNSSSTATYYLYASKEAASIRLIDEPATYQGALTLTKQVSISGVADPTDHNSGYAIQYNDTGGQITTTLSYDHSQFVSDSSSAPAICLQAGYAIQKQFTQVETDNQIIPILFELVNGRQVLGSTMDLGTTYMAQRSLAL